MIGRLRGTVGYKAEDHALIDVGGVGYLVYGAPRTLAGLGPVGGAATVYTDLVVREDLMQLFGFLTPLERDWHRILVLAPGVGAKVSLGILGVLGPDGVSRALALGDANALRKAPGVGPKVAQRIVNELKGKAPAILTLSDDADGLQTEPQGPQTELHESQMQPSEPQSAAKSPPRRKGAASKTTAAQEAYKAQTEALSALVNLGYGHGEAAPAVAQAQQDGASGTQALIRAALKALAPKE